MHNIINIIIVPGMNNCLEDVTFQIFLILALFSEYDNSRGVIEGFRLDSSGTARERIELSRRILSEVPLIDGYVLY